MAQAANKKKNNGRQSTKRTLSSSSVRKPATKKQPSRNKTKKLVVALPKNNLLTITFKVAAKKAPKKKASKQTPKRQKLLVPTLFILFGISGVFYSAWQMNSQPVLRSTAAPAPVLAQPVSITKSLMPSDATRLEIASIGVDAPVMMVDMQPDGTLEVPANLNKVGQYRLAPTPGEIGPAIIAGHVGVPNNHAVFWRLRELTPGEFIKITRQDGSIATFRVDTVKNFSQNDFPTQEVYGNIEHPGLRLITCGGTFNYLTRRYNENTVVFATLIP